MKRTEPADRTERGFTRVPFLFGLGLVEAIPDDAILARADPDDKDGDGISGRAGRDAEGHLARFGRKSENPTIESFIAGALLFEMGLTSPINPQEVLLDGKPLPDGVDPAPDPEVDSTSLHRLTDFVRFLAPAAPRPAQDAAESALIDRGQKLFSQIGCAACHTPSMRTGRNASRVLDRKTVTLYSDLLLHDMGPELAGFCGIAASPAEWRTEPLMGLRYRKEFLHDGRAGDLFEAIRMHGGEAARARDAFQGLDRLTQEALIRFLSTR